MVAPAMNRHARMGVADAACVGLTLSEGTKARKTPSTSLSTMGVRIAKSL